MPLAAFAYMTGGMLLPGECLDSPCLPLAIPSPLPLNISTKDQPANSADSGGEEWPRVLTKFADSPWLPILLQRAFLGFGNKT